MLRKETVEPATLGLLRAIVAEPHFNQFRLVGGTALSLLLGHRKSIDLDLFTDIPLDIDRMQWELEDKFGHIDVRNARQNIFQCVVNNVKIDFVSVKDQFTNPVNIIDGIPFADIKDLIALKLNAVKGRGVKKDFWDVARLLKEFSFNDLFTFYHDRYNYDDTFAVVRSVIYFEDAESTIEPESLDGTTWDDVKAIILEEFNKFSKSRYKN